MQKNIKKHIGNLKNVIGGIILLKRFLKIPWKIKIDVKTKYLRMKGSL
jgi:hypothetical protein